MHAVFQDGIQCFASKEYNPAIPAVKASIIASESSHSMAQDSGTIAPIFPATSCADDFFSFQHKSSLRILSSIFYHTFCKSVRLPYFVPSGALHSTFISSTERYQYAQYLVVGKESMAPGARIPQDVSFTEVTKNRQSLLACGAAQIVRGPFFIPGELLGSNRSCYPGCTRV
jgi:hypothetical protein